MFPGTNTLLLNEQTLIDALNEYMEKRINDLGTGARVTAVKPDSPTGFKVTLSDTNPSK